MSESVQDAERDGEARLRRELAHLQQRVRENEWIWSCFRKIEVRLIGAESLAELVSMLATDLPALFPSVQHVSVACLEPQFESAQRLGAIDASGRCFIPIARERLIECVGASPRPRLGPTTDAVRVHLFPHVNADIGSAAVAPLVLRGQLIGSLNQASADPAHFNPGAATDLLEHLAAVTAMCLDSALNRERLKQDGLTDPLTRIANRRLFERRLAEEIERWRRTGRPLACVLADIDRFKHINDSFGHAAGDRALQVIAEVLGRGLRASDVLARLGGEEFGLLLPDTSSEGAIAIAERLREAVMRASFSVAGHPVALTVSVGLACLPAHAGNARARLATDLLEQADAAMYSAKANGRNRVVTVPIRLQDQ